MNFNIDTDLNNFTTALDAAASTDELIAALEDWAPFTADALLVVQAPGFDFADFKAGLEAERRKESAGEVWARTYGDVVMPGALIKAALTAEHTHMPLGIVMARMIDLGAV